MSRTSQTHAERTDVAVWIARALAAVGAAPLSSTEVATLQRVLPLAAEPCGTAHAASAAHRSVAS
jgi:hypothetical protein